MLMSQFIAAARGLDLSELRQDLSLGRAAETAPDGYGGNLITPQTIAMWAYRHVKRIRFVPHGEKLRELDRDRQSSGFGRNLGMRFDVMHPTAGGARWNHQIEVMVYATINGREYGHALHVSAELFPKHHGALVHSARGLMQKLVRDALESSWDLLPENDDDAVGLNVVDMRDMNMFPSAERRSIRDARTIERFGWYGANLTPPDVRSRNPVTMTADAANAIAATYRGKAALESLGELASGPRSMITKTKRMTTAPA